jgi:putative FmdB family regulatory protein
VPIYEFLCESCGRITEVMQKVSDPPPRACQECGSRKIAKLVSRTAFQLKGGGWYADLYASKKPADGKAAAAPSPAAKAEAPPAAAKPTEKPPAAAAPAKPSPASKKARR